MNRRLLQDLRGFVFPTLLRLLLPLTGALLARCLSIRLRLCRLALTSCAVGAKVSLGVLTSLIDSGDPIIISYCRVPSYNEMDYNCSTYGKI